MGAKEKDPLTDAECTSETGPWPDRSRCAAHNQALLTCANGRLQQVKLARAMESRTMASARAWEQQAVEARVECNTLKAALQEERDR